MLPREYTMQIEAQTLSPFAFPASRSKGRRRTEPSCAFRTDFQRDRDRIIHCNSFRRLMHKTQVFLNPVSEHYRTRLTHTLEVAQIARTISRALRLNEDLTEAIALGHDLGHTPFGHDGERVLNQLHSEGFRHYEQSLRVVDVLEREGQGLNLTEEVRDGILNHTKGVAATLEGIVVKYADKIAYINHDIEDAIRGSVITEADLPQSCTSVLGHSKSERITSLIRAIVQHSMGKPEIGYDTATQEAHDALREYMFSHVYYAPVTNKEKTKAQKIVIYLYEYFLEHLSSMPPLYQTFAEQDGSSRAVCDYLSGMSDDYAVSVYQEICIPKAWNKNHQRF